MHESPYEREPGYAERYRDRRFATGSGAATDRRERRALRRLLERAEPAPGPWLDVPCGAGRLTDLLPGRKVQVDRDPTMVAAIPAAHPKACASAHALPFRDGAFGGVLCMRLMQHIPTADERIAILRELHRVTTGPLLVSFFDAISLQHLRRSLRPLFGRRRSGRYAVTRRTFARELQAAGFTVRAMHPLRRFLAEQTLVLAVPNPVQTTT